MAYHNHISIMGNLGKDPEIKTLQNGTTLATGSIAWTKSVLINKDTKEYRKDTHWIDFKAFGYVADKIAKHVRKGDSIQIHGELQQETWQTQEGANRSKHVVNINKLDIFHYKDDADGGPIQATQGIVTNDEEMNNNVPF